jgi:hypothetical protein
VKKIQKKKRKKKKQELPNTVRLHHGTPIVISNVPQPLQRKNTADLELFSAEFDLFSG